MTDEERAHPANGIWLCRECAKVIDADEASFPVALLDEWKSAHEAWVDTGRPIASSASWDRLLRESMGRCTAGWVKAGIDRSEAERWASDRSVPRLPLRLRGSEPTGLVALVGGMGVGKSLCAERWLQNRVLESGENPTAPIPVYVSADGLRLPLVDVVRNAARDLGSVDVHGASVVLDDLSRRSELEADRILEQARQVVYSLPTSSVLITSRPIPGLIRTDLDWAIPADPLDEEAAFELVRRAHGGDVSNVHQRAWAPSLREAIRWPLFAILTGTYLREHEVVSRITYSELLTYLVKRSLGSVTASRHAATRLLRKLAALSLETEGSLVPLAEVGRPAELGDLLASGLVEVRDEMVSIPLDILREWLAAQSIAEGENGIDGLLDDPRRLHSWRYPIMAAIGSSDFETSAELLRPLFERRPAQVARMISEETPEYAAGREAVPLADLRALGERVRTAMGFWTSALWPASGYLPALDDAGHLRGLGISASGQTLETRWRRHGHDPPVTVIGTRESTDEWATYHAGRPSTMLSWPWSWTMEEVRPRLGHAVRAKNVPMAEGPLLCEFAYEMARAVIRPDAKDGQPIPLSDVADWLAQLRAQPGHVVCYQKGALKFDPSRLEIAVDYLERRGKTALEKPYPAPDCLAGSQLLTGSWLGRPIPSPASDSHETDTWAWFGGDSGMKEAVRSVLVAALDGYRHTVRRWFPRLRQDLAHYVLQPAEVRVRLFRPEQPGYGGRAAFMLLPRESGRRQNVFDIAVDNESRSSLAWEDHLPWAEEQTSRIAEHRPDAAWWVRPRVHQDEIPLFGRMPACRLAMQWLYVDLLELSLVDGMAPLYSTFW